MERRIRILHVAQAAGGVDRYIRMLFKYMDHDKFENILVCSHDFKGEDYNGLADGFEHVDMQREIGKSDLAAIKEVRKFIGKYKPDIVYGHSSKAGAIARMANIGMKSADGERIKCIYNPHGWAFNMKCSRKKQMLYTAIEKIAAPFCDKIVCISEAEKKSALDRKICGEEKLQVILNGVDIEEYEQREAAGLTEVSRESLGIPGDAFIVGMVGRITKQKAPDVFIKAAKLIKKKIPEAYFIIVGDGTYQNRVKEYAAKHGLADSLLITGWVENASDYIDLFDVALLLSRWEGFGLAIPEYMLAGKPVVATRVDAIPSIIEDGKNGFLVDAEDAAGACDAVMRLYEDSGLRFNVINRGKITVHERYDAKRVSKEHQTVFDALYGLINSQ
jgi:glycosyltransferase involved in cell wall biosynthesis